MTRTKEEEAEEQYEVQNVNKQEKDDADGKPTRALWGSKWQFMLSCVSLSVGLGNVWRFPYLLQENGGGAFLIPYVIMMIVEGAPIFLIELGMGQRLRLGSLGVWNKVHHYLGGIGIASTIISFIISLYYNVLIAWCFYYLFNSFKHPLPYSTCPSVEGNSSVPVAECANTFPTTYFFYRQALDASPSIDDPQEIKWWMAMCLLLSWLLVYACIMKGIQSSGKIVYFTALFPYLILVIFFVRAITLPGASVGLAYMLKPKLEMLLSPTVWMKAATQVFYSLGLGFGSLIAFSSYNPTDNDCIHDSLFMCVVTVVTALFASVDIFAVLGNKAYLQQEKCIDQNLPNLTFTRPDLFAANMTRETYLQAIAQADNHTQLNYNCSIKSYLDKEKGGTGLAFITFTQAIIELPGSNFWSVAFFLMLLALGLGSQFGTMQGVITNLFDMNKRVRKELLTGLMCAVSFLIGLIFVTGAGEYWVQVFDSYGGTLGLAVVCFAEVLAVSYVYGHERFTEDTFEMTGRRPGVFWQICWRFLAPALLAICLLASLVEMFTNRSEYTAWDSETAKQIERPFPRLVMVVIAAMLIIAMVPIPLVALYRWLTSLRSGAPKIQPGFRTTPSTVAITRDMKIGEENEACEFDTTNTLNQVTFTIP